MAKMVSCRRQAALRRQAPLRLDDVGHMIGAGIRLPGREALKP